MAAQLSLTNVRSRRGLRSCSARAINSFPVPVSPRMSTVEPVAATVSTSFNTRRNALMQSLAELDDKIKLALSSGREDLAKAGVSRQIDLEAQIAALDKALSDATAHIDEGHKALQAVLATRREVEARLAELRKSMEIHPAEAMPGRARAGQSAARAAAVPAVAGGRPRHRADPLVARPGRPSPGPAQPVPAHPRPGGARLRLVSGPVVCRRDPRTGPFRA